MAPWLSGIALLGECRAHAALRARPPASKGRFLSISTLPVTAAAAAAAAAPPHTARHGVNCRFAPAPLHKAASSEVGTLALLSFHKFWASPSLPPARVFHPSTDERVVRRAHRSGHTLFARTTMASIPTGPAADRRADSRRLADFAAKAAETFVSALLRGVGFAAAHQPRTHALLPNSSIVWNGTPVSGSRSCRPCSTACRAASTKCIRSTATR